MSQWVSSCKNHSQAVVESGGMLLLEFRQKKPQCDNVADTVV